MALVRELLVARFFKSIVAACVAACFFSCASAPPVPPAPPEPPVPAAPKVRKTPLPFIIGDASDPETKFARKLQQIVRQIGEDETMAVACVYDAVTKDVTELGNRWRNRIEKALNRAGATVKARKDIVVLIDDVNTFGFKVTDVTETEIWRQGYAQVVVIGEYVVVPPSRPGTPHRIELDIRAYRVSDSTYVEGVAWTEYLKPGWEMFSSQVRENAFVHKWTNVFGDKEDEGPALSAKLTRSPPCYPPETPVTIDIETETNAYLYVLYFANNTEPWLLWPNAYQKEPKPLETGKTMFPPEQFKDEFGIYTFLPEGKEDQPVNETVTVVSSREKLDFSFLPEASHTPYLSISGADVNRVYKVLKSAAGKATAADLKFTVSNRCLSNDRSEQ